MSRKDYCTLSDELICKFEKGDSYYEDETQRHVLGRLAPCRDPVRIFVMDCWRNDGSY